ncbi:MAG: hypothetical protein LBU89_07695 [Fibromonadaceae bacterium]|nr:hypothetical protein [Fibromonadaceae bacterium]
MKIIKILPYGFLGNLQSIAALIGFKPFEYRENTVLLLEPYDVHGEVIPGLVKYLLDLGYNVDVIISMTGRGRNDTSLFSSFEKNDKVRVKSMAGYKINRLLRTSPLKHYKHIIINSFYDKDINFYKVDLFKLKPVCMLHNPNITEPYFKTNKIISLVKMDCINREPPLVVNSHYFGDITKSNKSETTTFIAFNSKNLFRRNLHLLFRACDALYKKKINNFCVKIIGKGIAIPPVYRDNFLVFESLNFKQMFDEVSKSDFLLGLIDAASVEYANKASGSFQLSYGFSKPIILHSKFGGNSGFTNDNSVLHDSNDSLASAMENCINMSENDYSLMVAELEKTEKQLYKDSLNNLKRAMEEDL